MIAATKVGTLDMMEVTAMTAEEATAIEVSTAHAEADAMTAIARRRTWRL
jgi:hypothetical protein